MGFNAIQKTNEEKSFADHQKDVNSMYRLFVQGLIHRHHRNNKIDINDDTAAIIIAGLDVIVKNEMAMEHLRKMSELSSTNTVDEIKNLYQWAHNRDNYLRSSKCRDIADCEAMQHIKQLWIRPPKQNESYDWKTYFVSITDELTDGTSFGEFELQLKIHRFLSFLQMSEPLTNGFEIFNLMSTLPHVMQLVDHVNKYPLDMDICKDINEMIIDVVSVMTRICPLREHAKIRSTVSCPQMTKYFAAREMFIDLSKMVHKSRFDLMRDVPSDINKVLQSCAQYICTTTTGHQDPFIEFVEEYAVELFGYIVRLVIKTREKRMETQWNKNDVIQRMKEIAGYVSPELEKKAKALIERLTPQPQSRSRFLSITQMHQEVITTAMNSSNTTA